MKNQVVEKSIEKSIEKPLGKSQKLALVSLGLVTGFYLTKAVKPGLIIALVIGAFMAGVLFDTYKPNITFGETKTFNQKQGEKA